MKNNPGSVQFSSVTQSCLTLLDLMNQARQASLPITNSRSSLRLMSITSVMPSNHLILSTINIHLILMSQSLRVGWFSQTVCIHDCATIIYSIWAPYLYGKRRKSQENGLEKFLPRLGRSICHFLSHLRGTMSMYLQDNLKGEQEIQTSSVPGKRKEVSIYLASTTIIMLYSNKMWSGRNRKILTF